MSDVLSEEECAELRTMYANLAAREDIAVIDEAAGQDIAALLDTIDALRAEVATWKRNASVNASAALDNKRERDEARRLAEALADGSYQPGPLPWEGDGE